MFSNDHDVIEVIRQFDEKAIVLWDRDCAELSSGFSRMWVFAGTIFSDRIDVYVSNSLSAEITFTWNFGYDKWQIQKSIAL